MYSMLLKKTKFIFFILTISVSFLIPNLLPVQANYTEEYFSAVYQESTASVPTRLIVGTKNRGIFGLLGKPNQNTIAQQMEAASPGTEVRLVRKHGDFQIFDTGKNLNPAEYQQIANSLTKVSGVISVEQDYFILPEETVPNDPYMADNPSSSQYQYSIKKDGYLFGMAEYPYWGINALDAWDITQGDPNLYVAVLDTGIIDHTDLNGRWVGGYDFVSYLDTSGDGDGWDPDPHDTSYLAVNQGTSTWHGAHVAGTIGAKANNSFGIAGLNWNSMIVPVRVLGWGGGYLSDTAPGIEWAAGLPVSGVPDNPNPARVLNLSLGSQTSCPSYMQTSIDKVYNAGGIIVVAAGNSNMDAMNFTPANCNHVITVAAAKMVISPDLDRNYSNYGSKITITAPGTEVYSTTFASKTNFTSVISGKNGTSMASPHVAGVVSLMLSANPALTFEQVVATLQNTARAFPAGSWCTTNPGNCGAGLMDAYAAVQAAASIHISTATTVPPTPTATFTATPVPPTPTATFTATPVPPTPTATFTATSVPPTPTATFTATPVPPTPTATFTATPVPPTPTATAEALKVFPSTVNTLEDNKLVLSGMNFGDDPNPVIELIDSATGNLVSSLEACMVSSTEIHILLPTDTLPIGAYKVRVIWTISGQDYATTSSQTFTVVDHYKVLLPLLVK